MALDVLPDWLPVWCVAWLGALPVEVLFEVSHMSRVFGLRLADGREVVVKARPSEPRVAACVEAQKQLAAQGFPCARPLTAAVVVDGLAVHAEEFRPGGAVLAGDSPEIAAGYAEVFARLMAGLESVKVAPPLPTPRWAAWDHDDSGVWPAIGELDERDQGAVPSYVVEVAVRVRKVLLAQAFPRVLGHVDFEAQNLRWEGRRIVTVHDWDSLAWLPEAALVGAASGAFASQSPPTLAPIASSEAFLETYEAGRGRAFGGEETRVAWAASLWTAAHNARWEALHGDPPVSLDAVADQAAERLRRAGA